MISAISRPAVQLSPLVSAFEKTHVGQALFNIHLNQLPLLVGHGIDLRFLWQVLRDSDKKKKKMYDGGIIRPTYTHSQAQQPRTLTHSTLRGSARVASLSPGISRDKD